MWKSGLGLYLKLLCAVKSLLPQSMFPQFPSKPIGGEDPPSDLLQWALIGIQKENDGGRKALAFSNIFRHSHMLAALAHLTPTSCSAEPQPLPGVCLRVTSSSFQLWGPQKCQKHYSTWCNVNASSRQPVSQNVLFLWVLHSHSFSHVTERKHMEGNERSSTLVVSFWPSVWAVLFLGYMLFLCAVKEDCVCVSVCVSVCERV